MSSRLYVTSRDAVAREVGGDVIIVPVCGDVAEMEAIFTTNEVGGFLWRQLATPRTVTQLAEALCEAFEVNHPTAVSDASSFLSALLQAGLVREVEVDHTGAG